MTRMFENCFVFIIFLLGTIIVAHGNSEFNNEMLRLHNEYRKTHHSDKLKLDDFMSDKAMECAKQIMQGISTSCEPRGPQGPYGINLFTLVSPYQLTAQHVCSTWYSYEKNYNYLKQPEVGTNADFFTQIVWKSTIKLGVAFLYENDGYVIVAIYDPPGNIHGKYSDNVLMP